MATSPSQKFRRSSSLKKLGSVGENPQKPSKKKRFNTTGICKLENEEQTSSTQESFKIWEMNAKDVRSLSLGRDKSVSDDNDETLCSSLPTARDFVSHSQQQEECAIDAHACMTQHAKAHETEVRKDIDALEQENRQGAPAKTTFLSAFGNSDSRQPCQSNRTGHTTEPEGRPVFHPTHSALNQKEGSVAQREEEARKLKEENEQLKNVVKHLENEQTHMKAEWEKEWTQREELTKRLDVKNQLKEQLQMREKTLTKMKEHMDSQASEMESLQRKNDELNKEVLDHLFSQRELKEYSQGRDSKMQLLQDKTAQLKQTVSILNEELDTTKRKLESRIKLDSEAMRELRSANHENKRMSQTLTEFQDKIAQLERTVSTLEEELDTANLKILAKAKIEFNWNQELKSAQQTGHALAELQEQNSLLQTQVQVNQADFKQERADRTSAAAKYEKEKEQSARIIKQLQVRLKRKEEEVVGFKETNAKLTQLMNNRGMHNQSDHHWHDNQLKGRHDNNDEETAMRIATLESEKDRLIHDRKRQQADHEQQYVLLSRELRDAREAEDALLQRVAGLEQELKASKATAVRAPPVSVVARSPFLPNKEIAARQVPGIESDFVEKDGYRPPYVLQTHNARGDSGYSDGARKPAQNSPQPPVRSSKSPALASKFDENASYGKSLDLSGSLPRPMHLLENLTPGQRGQVPIDNSYSQTQLDSELQQPEKGRHPSFQVYKSLSSESDSSFQPNQQYIGNDINREIRKEAKDYRKHAERGLPASESIDETAWPYDPNLQCKHCGKKFRQGQIREFRYHIDDQHAPSVK